MNRIVRALFLGGALSLPAVSIAYQAELKDDYKIVLTSPDAANPSLQQVRDAIVTGAASHGWALKSETPGRLVLALEHKGGKHRLEVAANYTEAGYQIEYLSSDNLKYAKASDGSQVIDSAYYRWLSSMAAATRKSLTVK